MKELTQFPYDITETAHAWIPMRDGARLAARIWMPENAKNNPVPAVLEYIPYRKRDFTALRDEVMHPYFAGHGYAAVRVDLRGSGDSDGILTDEYLQQELDDGVDVINWLAGQDWCNGRVGMIGKSWGGFNGLQIAYLQPEALKAVITVCSTDDRYSDDVHYMGGCLLGDNLSWASTMFAYNSCPPDPAIIGKSWRERWHERIEQSGLWLKTWLEHQARDAYWEHGSICEDYARVQCPVMAVSGWADGYSNAVFRLMEHLRVPRLGLIGPWSHKYPHKGVPGPAIGFLQEALRWWDHWLKKKETGIMQEPMLRVWMQDSMPPHASYRERYGRWVGEPGWPSEAIDDYSYHFGKKIMVAEDEDGETCRPEDRLYIQSPLSLGLFAGKWCSYSATPDLPHDQREEDGGALVFDSAPLEEPLEILGSPEVELSFACDRPQAMVCVRLSDIAPDNKATRVTYGLLNLTHRNSHAKPEPLEPGRRYTVRVRLNGIAQHFPEGHWLRVAVSTSYWPLAWPSPESPRLSVYPKDCALHLPRRRHPQCDDEAISFAEPEGAKPSASRRLSTPEYNWLVTRDLAEDTSLMEVIKNDGTWYQEQADLTLRNKALEWYSHRRDDYTSLRGETYWEREFRRDDWHVFIKTRTVLTSNVSHFFLRAELDAYEGDTRVKSLNWDETIPRYMV